MVVKSSNRRILPLATYSRNIWCLRIRLLGRKSVTAWKTPTRCEPESKIRSSLLMTTWAGSGAQVRPFRNSSKNPPSAQSSRASRQSIQRGPCGCWRISPLNSPGAFTTLRLVTRTFAPWRSRPRCMSWRARRKDVVPKSLRLPTSSTRSCKIRIGTRISCLRFSQFSMLHADSS